MAPKRQSSKQSDEISLLIKQRNQAKASILRISDRVSKAEFELSSEELDCRLEIVETYFAQALEYQNSIEQYNFEPENAIALDVRSDLEDLYCRTKVKIRSLMTRNLHKTNIKPIVSESSSRNIENLPKLKLPTFSGKYSEYPNFIRLFTTLVHEDSRLTKIEKFNHLHSCLSGAALRTIKALNLVDDNYETALELLEQRFNNKYLMCQEHIRELVRINKVQKGSAEQLRCLIDTVNAHLNALCSLLSYEEIVNALIVHFVMAAVDNDSQSKIEESIECSTAVSWSQCVKVLTQRCQMLEAREPAGVATQVQPRNSKQNTRNANPVAFPAVATSCKLCNQHNDHFLWKCPKFLELSTIQRYEAVKKLALCINCFSSKHSVRQCKSSNCRHCKESHNTLLHRGETSTSTLEADTDHRQQQTLASQNHNHTPATVLVSKSCVNSKTVLKPKYDQQQTILATAVVKVTDKFGNDHSARALLDSASQLNFITNDLAHKLSLDRVKSFITIGGIGQTNTMSKYSTTVCISSCTTDYSESLLFLILPTITGTQPGSKINIESWTIPESLNLADPNFNVPQRIDMLIGADMFFNIFQGNQQKVTHTGPTLFETKLGWVVAGKCNHSSQLRHAFVVDSKSNNLDENLDQMVQQFWDLEKIPGTTRKLSKEHAECEKYFAETTSRLPDGRFMVRLPFKEDVCTLGDSKQLAMRRLSSLEKRLNADVKLKESYFEFLQQYESDGHMQKIPWPSNLKGYYFLPHHCVIRPDKTTTKCRVVFDASAKTTNGVSLNDILKIGPVVQNDLVDILMRFRLHKYGLMADITAMYRQIWVHPSDRKVQNIIWKDSNNGLQQAFELKTVTYGTASAPYLATRCLVQLAHDNKGSNPEVSSIIKNDFYVDDLVTGGSSLEQIKKIKTEVTEILQQGCFPAHKWHSNHTMILSNLPENEREKAIKIEGAAVVKTLGVIWDAESDCFKFNYKHLDRKTTSVTKRTVLSELSRLYDPLGLVKPIIVKAKVFLQELWLKQLTWDDEIPSECAEAWHKYVDQLSELNSIQVPRYVMQTNSEVELHGFADASTRAYGACFYVRCKDESNEVKVTLLTSRSKVAPISVLRSLPCLELCAAHLLVQLLEKVRSIASFTNIFLWSDSVIVLNWIAEHASNFNTFVANRVAYIQEQSEKLSWKYVPSGSNPADILSRGGSVDELKNSNWFSGPAFLTKPIDLWPQPPKRLAQCDLPERKVQKTVLVVSRNTLLDKLHQKSSFTKICKLVAIIKRFANCCRSNSFRAGCHSLNITVTELDDALMHIVIMIQKVHFYDEIKNLKAHRSVPQRSKLKELNPFIEKCSAGEILKVGGRLRNAELPYVTQCPIILPSNDPFVKTYVKHLHMTNFHAGAQALVCFIRNRFWIIGARNYARKVVKECVHCFKYRPKLQEQIMSDLPADRVIPAKPFTKCGVDFCGPIMTTYRVRGKPLYKTYIAVFVCFVTRAVHLEVVSSLTTDAFIGALKRFVARRGLCSTLYCDNATNFIGARNALKEFKALFISQQFQGTLTNWCTGQGINFKPIPPRAPHFGGLWEAAVKSAKTLLYKAMQSVVMTFEELATVVTQIEGILNSRPLTPLTNDPSDEAALTPAHFLNTANANCLLEPKIINKPWSTLNHWQQITAIQQHFWARWSKEYIVSLQQRHKWLKRNPNIQVGTLVLIHEDNLPPQKWLLGRITKVIAGKDGNVRVAEVKTQSGMLSRAIVKLAPLPIDDNIETP